LPEWPPIYTHGYVLKLRLIYSCDGFMTYYSKGPKSNMDLSFTKVSFHMVINDIVNYNGIERGIVPVVSHVVLKGKYWPGFPSD